MSVAEYHFVSNWEIDAPIEEVFDAILDSTRWPEWWRGVPRVEEVTPGDPNGIGNVRRYTFRSLLPYNLVFEVRTTRIERPALLEGASSGELAGIGRWELEATAGGTHVRYRWDVHTTKAWMNVLAPIARPVFNWNHDIVMRWGEEGLRRHLRAAG